MKTPSATTWARLAVGAVLLWAATGKIAHPSVFFNSLLDYEVPLPEWSLRLVAASLPWLEAFCGLALVLDFWRESVRPLVAALCAVFAAMLGQAVVRGLDLSCGCFGSAPGGWLERPGVAFARAVLLLGLSLWLAAPEAAAAPRPAT